MAHHLQSDIIKYVAFAAIISCIRETIEYYLHFICPMFDCGDAPS